MSAMLYELLQSKKFTSSGVGTSYYGSTALCGMKGRLQALFPFDEEQASDGTDLTPTGKRKVNARRCGQFYHALQEFWRLEVVPPQTIVACDHFDYDFELALNSFVKYRTHFGNNRHNLGHVRGAEVRIPEIDEAGNLTSKGEQQHERILRFTGGLPFSMRYDLLGNIDGEHMAQIAIERQLAVPGEGDYLIDYKLVGSITASTLWQYSYDFQQLAYPVIFNVANPDAPVKGMLTEVQARVLKPEPRHFALYLAFADHNAQQIVRHGIQGADQSRAIGSANPFACTAGKYGPCFFLTSGVCPRHGRFDEFDFSNGRPE